MRRAVPILAAIVLVLLIGGAYFGQNTLEKYSYSRERADLKEYFGISGEQDVPIILEHERIETHARRIGGGIYLAAQDVDALLNDGFYVGEADGTLLYTTATRTYSASIGEASWSCTDGSAGEEALPIALREGEEVYLLLDYVKRFTRLRYDYYEDPGRIVLRTSWGIEQRATVTRDTGLRVLGGVKSEVLCDLEKGQQVFLLEPMETWTKVETADGFIGYVENRRLSEPIEVETLAPAALEEEYTSIRKPYKINLGWHAVYAAAGNGTLEELIAQTSAGEEGGLNTIAPTWFAVKDGEGNIRSFADASYVKRAHAKGLEVWGVVDNFNEQGADTGSTLSRAASRANLMGQLIDAARSVGLDGINVDFEQVPSASGEDFIQWIRELSVACRREQLVLSIDNYVPMGSLNDHYDRREQGVVADYVIVMAYDEHYSGSSEAGSVASIGYVEDGIRRTVAEVPPEKVVGAMPFYTRIWSTKNGEVGCSAVDMAKAKAWVEEQGVALTWDEETCQNYGERTDSDGSLRQVWMEDADSIRTKINVMKSYGIGGVAAWRLGFETPDIWDVIAQALQ